MAENLPLITDKNDIICADVRPVLREVFRELDSLPPLVPNQPHRESVEESGDCNNFQSNKWAENYTKECKKLWKNEMELKHEYAKRLSRQPLPNPYKIYSPKTQRRYKTGWKKERGVISRSDLIPSIVQNAGRDASLWVRNILSRSSGDLTSTELRDAKPQQPIQLSSFVRNSLQSLSIGEVMPRPLKLPASELPPPLQPEYILCVPPQLDFVNFTVGILHSLSVRLVNVSKFEIRLSLRPPRHSELDVELCGSRGLTVTSGSSAELKVHFRPRDVRALHDVLEVRVSAGRSLVVPIACYMQPPMLHVLVPSIESAGFSFSVEEANYENVASSSEVLELGAKLLGDVHITRLLLQCDAEHASFFILPEDAWISYSIDGLTTDSSVISDSFALYPAWWRGGGTVRGCAWFLAPGPGAHTAMFRILSSTAIVRPLDIIADSLYYSREHITLVAQEKDYDICSEEDPDCEYYVHLGTAFPHRSLSTSITLVNHSPVTYSYYWSMRPWGICSCWEKGQKAEGTSSSEDDEEKLCAGALVTKHNADSAIIDSPKYIYARMVKVEPTQGQIPPRSSSSLSIATPDVGWELGVKRAVLMLILRDIPKESFPPNFDPMIVSTKSVESETIPGIKGPVREVCEVICCQLEVWWEVAPVRFVLDPCVIPLVHSTRVHSVDVEIRATQLFGCDPIYAEWLVPNKDQLIPPSKLTPFNSCHQIIHIPLSNLPSDYPDMDVIKLVAENGEWESRCSVIRRCETRHPALRPARVWLGVVHPGSLMHTTLDVVNDTHQQICWWSESFRWWSESMPSTACTGRPPCETCQERSCSCNMLKPARGTLQHGDTAVIHYRVIAPETDVCVATLVQVKQTGPDVARVPGGAGSEARATLVAYRVLAPRLVMRVLSCRGSNNGCCDGHEGAEACPLDPGALKSERGTAILRPLEALSLGRRTCYRLKFTNLTPLSAEVCWDTPIESEEFLNVRFLPYRFSVKGYGECEIRVVLEARKVCRRRLFVCRALVASAYKPLYLIVDAAIAGLEISCEIPIGDELKTDSFVVMRRSQREDHPWEAGMLKATSILEIFAEEDRTRAIVNENVCRCSYKMEYIPLKKSLRPPSMETPIEIVRSRTMILRNHSILTARWSSAIRRWPRLHTRTIDSDKWAADVRDPGVVLQCRPADGVLLSKAQLSVEVEVYADSWGVFHDQVLIMIDHIEPIVVDVWIEAVGPPLQFALKPTRAETEDYPTLWLSGSDPERTLQVKNVSRSELDVQAYVLTQNDQHQNIMPFRLYYRFYDVPIRTCPCVDTNGKEADETTSVSGDSTYTEEMHTLIELYLAPDFGVQNETCFKVTPEVITIAPGTWKEWKVQLLPPLHYEVASSCNLILRTVPKNKIGEFWYRPDPPAQRASLKQVEREAVIKASCTKIHVQLCALDLPYQEVMRVRKRFRLLNIGNGPQYLTASTEAPWTILLNHKQHTCGCDCVCVDEENITVERREQVPLYLEQRSSTEICLELKVDGTEDRPEGVDSAGPCQSCNYSEFKITKTSLCFYDDDNVLLNIPLISEIEYPKLLVKPREIDFGYVTDGDTRKTYFTVSHSSRSVTLDVTIEFIGGNGFKVWPPFLHLPPNANERVYVQYTSIWSRAPVEGCVHIRAGQPRPWCHAAVTCRASPSRDHKFRATVHDHTDDMHLLPPDLVL